MERHARLAVIGGFVRVPASAPFGSQHASFRLCQAIARAGRWKQIDVFHEDVDRLSGREGIALPPGVPSRLVERARLKTSGGLYDAIYVANGEQMQFAPHGLRPDEDPAPVICEIGTAHHPAQWTNFFLAAFTGLLRPTDGFVFKTRTVQDLFARVWEEWNGRTGPLPFPTGTVIPNGVDLAANRRDDQLRAATRQQLGLRDGDVAFLTFSRLAAGTKGDFRALLALWKRVVERSPRAILVLSGKVVQPAFVLHLQTSAREAGLASNLLICGDPYDVWPDARERLMSAADVFVHLSTGAEETSPQAVHEAMAYSLPVIASRWAGLPEMIEHQGNGFLIPTHLSEPPPSLQRMMFARSTSATNTELGRCVGCDGEAFVRAAEALLSQENRRREMGQASRRRVEALFDLEQVAARRVAFFEDLARRARAAGAPPPGRDLVSFQSILWSMGQRPLQPADRIELCQEEGFRFVREAPAVARDSSTVALVEFVLREAGSITAGELATRVQMLSGEGSDHLGSEVLDPGVWRACSRTVIRLISYGVARVEEEQDDDRSDRSLAARADS